MKEGWKTQWLHWNNSSQNIVSAAEALLYIVGGENLGSVFAVGSILSPTILFISLIVIPCFYIPPQREKGEY